MNATSKCKSFSNNEFPIKKKTKTKLRHQLLILYHILTFESERPLDRLFIEAFILTPTIQSEVKATYTDWGHLRFKIAHDLYNIYIHNKYTGGK